MRIFSPKNSSGFHWKKWKINWKKVWKITGIVAGVGFLFVVGVFAWFYKDLPSSANISQRFVAESTKIYDRTGQHVLYDIHGEEKRTQIPFAEMTDSVRYATISLEDQKFYTNYGIEVTSIIRAGIADVLRRGATQGASTITQQLVKQTMLTPEKTLSRKIKEAILSLELAQKFSKDEILGMYLNQIPYGSNAYGIESASQTFFGRHAKELTLDESALLASLPQAPTYYSPYGNHTDALIARQRYALNQMAKLGYITQDQADEAKQVDIMSKIKPFSENISAPHFVMFVKDYLANKYGDQALETSGMKIITTLDWDKQQLAEQAVKENADKNIKYKAGNAALVAMDPKTGQILAMVGSKDYFGASSPNGCQTGKNCTFEGNFNVATANRQPGSSFKPYVYLTAFKKGYTPETQLWDVDTNFSTDSGKDYSPKDYDGKNRGPLQMKDALAMSLNIPAVETLYLAGVKDSIDQARSMGITTLTDPNKYGLSLVLGGGEVTLLDHTNAFSSFATGGIYHPKTAILKIEDSTGKVLEQFKDDPGERVIDEKYVSMIDYIMSTNDLRAPIFGANNPLSFSNRPVAAKTGTTNEWRDGWTMGYTPSLAVGVWAGNNDNSTMAQGADGIFVAAPIFRSFMDKTLGNYPVESFPKYEKEDTGKDVLDGKIKAKEELAVCEYKKDKYCLANDSCPDDTKDTKKFSEAHSILYYVDRNNPRGDAPKNPETDPQYNNWEKAVQKWIKGNKDYSGDAPPTEQCKPDDFGDSNSDLDITTAVSTPKDGDTITSSPFTISASAVSGYDITKMNINVDGTDVYSQDNTSSISYSYAVPDDKKTATLNIKVTATDKKDRNDSDKLSVKTNIP